jgi:signal transduction histidine kinase
LGLDGANALAAVEKGGNIDLESRVENGDTVAAAIQDEGPGMLPETLDHIFEPFFTTKRA